MEVTDYGHEVIVFQVTVLRSTFINFRMTSVNVIEITLYKKLRNKYFFSDFDVLIF